ncbi:2Fe-2S iron-sulfur cluster-binding protein [Escherichia coli]
MPPGLKEKKIRTLEGEAKGGKLSHVQQAYAKSAQCSAGFVRLAIISHHGNVAKRREKPLTITEIRRGLAGNLCRCTGYQMIVNTVLDCEKTK